MAAGLSVDTYALIVLMPSFVVEVARNFNNAAFNGFFFDVVLKSAGISLDSISIPLFKGEEVNSPRHAPVKDRINADVISKKRDVANLAHLLF